MTDGPAPRRRRAPLVAPSRAPAEALEVETPAGPAPATPRRGLASSIALGVGVALAIAPLLYGLIAGPIYMLAQITTDGLNRPAFRTAFRVSLLFSALFGVVAGAATGRWAARGGRLPTDRTSFSDR